LLGQLDLLGCRTAVEADLEPINQELQDAPVRSFVSLGDLPRGRYDVFQQVASEFRLAGVKITDSAVAHGVAQDGPVGLNVLDSLYNTSDATLPPPRRRNNVLTVGKLAMRPRRRRHAPLQQRTAPPPSPVFRRDVQRWSKYWH